MLSVHGLSGGDQGYYLSLANINYYAEGGEPLPVMVGLLCNELGIRENSTIPKEHIERLYAGFHHETGAKLVQNAGVTGGDKQRSPGHDMTFSAPKCVSAIFGIADDTLREQLRAAQERSVAKTLEAAQAYCGLARVGRDGLHHVDAPLMWALFHHSTNRALEPALHTHSLLCNLTVIDSGGGPKTRTIDPTSIYHWKMALGSLYRADLAREIQQLGFEVELVRNDDGKPVWFKVVGVPEELMEFWATRRAEIELHLELEYGAMDAATARMKEIACLATRRKKEEEKPLGEMQEQWREEARPFGFDQQYVESLRRPYQKPSVQEIDARKEDVWTRAISRLGYHEAHWSEKDMIRCVSEYAAGSLTADEVRELVVHKIRSEELLERGQLITAEKDPNRNQYLDRLESRYTTPQIMKREARFIESVRRRADEEPHEVAPDIIEKVFAKYPTIEPEQKAAVEKLVTGGPIRLLTGTAGTGKGFTLTACHDVWKEEGRTVIGIAEAGRTAIRLEDDTEIPSRTMAKTLLQLQHGRLKLDKNTTIVVDEAGMLGTIPLAKLEEHAQKSGARIVLAGDSWQLQPVQAGAPYKILGKVLGDDAEAKLNHIRRQEQEWAREAVHDLKAGRAEDALEKFIANKQFEVTESRREAIGKVIEHWVSYGGVQDPEKSLMITPLNGEVALLNRQAQACRIRAGLVDAEQKMAINGMMVHVGDHVVLKAPSKRYGLVNGDLGTVTGVDPEDKKLTVKLRRDDREITLNLNTHAKLYSEKKVQLAYAQTTHLLQGATCENIAVLMGMMTDRHQGYVQGSRAKKITNLVIDQLSAGPELKDLIRTLGRDRRKTMAHEVFDRQKLEPRKAKEQEREEKKERQKPVPTRPLQGKGGRPGQSQQPEVERPEPPKIPKPTPLPPRPPLPPDPAEKQRQQQQQQIRGPRLSP